MSAVFTEIELGWMGERYTIQPNMKLVQKIEQEVSIAGLIHRANQGDLPMSHVAFVLSALLIRAGAKEADQDSVYRELYLNQTLLIDAIKAIAASFLPGGNSDSPDLAAAESGETTSRITEKTSTEKTPTSIGAVSTTP